ncbi:hypothetical protein GCHA_3178 [Paraglaciecola chathamensis S18K6]|uniref:Uncharacterized protein n=1 Tax=Paraglaciecola chathamensis S18K6 TaxID=1127672 RepID=A0AAV3V2E7_9ALTE|nr:hypothetical protein GCHA_3178 [Paraglaciecola chathamensis S18K6]
MTKSPAVIDSGCAFYKNWLGTQGLICIYMKLICLSAQFIDVALKKSTIRASI